MLVPLPRPAPTFLSAPAGLPPTDDARPLAPPPLPLPASHPLPADRVHHRRADAVQPAGVVVALGLELSTRVQRGEDQLEGGLLVLGVAVDRDAAAVVGDRGRRAIL